MRAIALLSTYNEERFIARNLAHLVGQGLDVVLIDDGSTDRTVALAERYLGRGLLRIMELQRGPHYTWRRILELKERLAQELDADWFLHVDADEWRLPWSPGQTLLQCLAQVDAEGYNAVEFTEFTFLPTREAPDHEHADFEQTMRWYHAYRPFTPHKLNAWKKQGAQVELAWSGGHIVRFPGLKSYPRILPMKHYLFLSIPHAVEKYVRRSFDPAEVAHGWHEWRAHVRPDDFVLPPQRTLAYCSRHADLDASSPRKTYLVEDRVMERMRRLEPLAG